MTRHFMGKVDNDRCGVERQYHPFHGRHVRFFLAEVGGQGDDRGHNGVRLGKQAGIQEADSYESQGEGDGRLKEPLFEPPPGSEG